MSSGAPVNVSRTYFIDGKTVSAASGEAFVRVPAGGKGVLAPVRRLAYRLSFPLAHFEMLDRYFTTKTLFRFEIHRQLQLELSVTAVLSELSRKSDDSAECLVEFDLP
jgi:hypothetical protein